MIKNNKYFILFSCCVLVKGKEGSMIYDLQRRRYYPIDNTAYQLLNLFKHFTIKDIKKQYNFEQNEGIDGYINFFIDEELGFISESTESFPPISLSWDSSSSITNAIIEIDSCTNYNIDRLILELSKLGCNDIQIRCLSYSKKIQQLLSKTLYTLRSTVIKGVEILIPHSSFIKESFFKELIEKEKVIAMIIIYNSIENLLVRDKNRAIDAKLKYLKRDLIELEEASKSIFFFNQDSFLEAQNHNIGLNRKVSITSSGLIKNYLTHGKSFGHVDSVLLKELIESDSFTEQWYINNDNILKCQECEFKYMCINNSEIIKEKNKYRRKVYCSNNQVKSKILA